MALWDREGAMNAPVQPSLSERRFFSLNDKIFRNHIALHITVLYFNLHNINKIRKQYCHNVSIGLRDQNSATFSRHFERTNDS